MVGDAVTVARDASEFERLQELGDVLGLTPMDTNSVRLDLAEKGFRQQVQEVQIPRPVQIQYTCMHRSARVMLFPGPAEASRVVPNSPCSNAVPLASN